VVVGETVTLDASGSHDVDGDELNYRWSLTSQPTGSLAQLSDPAAVGPTFVADMAGSYTVQLIVNDPGHASAPDTVTILAVNGEPSANDGEHSEGGGRGSGGGLFGVLMALLMSGLSLLRCVHPSLGEKTSLRRCRQGARH
jgi:hypothetical protein